MADIRALAGRLAGKFIVIDGPDGAGKGTQIAMLSRLLAGGGRACVTTHDPGDTPTGEALRQILLHSQQKLDVATEVLLFMASRAQLVAEKIRPALSAGSIVLCDRFISSTCAYQGANGASMDAILALGRFAVGDTWPDVTIVLDLPAEEGLRRIGVAKERTGRRKPNGREPEAQSVLFKDAVADSMESRSLEFHRRVAGIFRELAKFYPRPVELADASAAPQAVHEQIVAALARRFPV